MPRWLKAVLHILVILGGIAGSVKEQSIYPLIGSGAINAVVASPVDKRRD